MSLTSLEVPPMPLTVREVQSARPGQKQYKLSDGGGLFLLVHPNGSRYWRLKYRWRGRENIHALGVYPTISLAEARQRRSEAKKMLARGVDPNAERRAARLTETETFERVAGEWHGRRAPTWTAGYAEKVARQLAQHVYPRLGRRPIGQITAQELLSVLRRVEERGSIETAHRLLQNCSQIFRYAVAAEKADNNPAANLRGALRPVSAQHYPSVTDPTTVGALLRAIDGYEGQPTVQAALRLAPLVFVRPGELRHAEWTEINLVGAEWRIPAERMKLRAQHIVPLARQATEVLRELNDVSGQGRYVFPSIRSADRPISGNTLNAALRRMGYSRDEMTAHGFRSIASTMLNEHGWNRDWIERQLAHGERNSVRAAYNFAEYLPERRRMMQWWADHLDALKAQSR